MCLIPVKGKAYPVCRLDPPPGRDPGGRQSIVVSVFLYLSPFLLLFLKKKSVGKISAGED